MEEDSCDKKVFRNSMAHSTYSHHFHSKLIAMQKSSTFTDFTIKVGNDRYHCHQLVLAAACPYFETMFNCSLIEVHDKEVFFPTLSSRAVHRLVGYFYTGSIEVQWDDIKDVLEACQMLQMEKLQRDLEKFVCQKMEVGDVIGCLAYACKLDLESIMSQGHTILCSDFREVCDGEEFESLDTAYILDLLHFVRAKKINSDLMLDACISWTLCRDDRICDLKDLLLVVDLDRCSVKCLSDAIANTEQFKDESSQMMLLTAHHKSVRESKSKIPPLVLIGGTNVTRFCRLNKETESWEQRWTLTSRSSDKDSLDRVVQVKQGFVCITGEAKGKSVAYSKCRLVSNNYKDVKQLPSLPGPYNNYIKVTSSGSKVYVIGRQNTSENYALQMLDVSSSKKWTSPLGGHLMHSETEPVMAAVGSKVYILFDVSKQHQRNGKSIAFHCYDSRSNGFSAEPLPPITSVKGATATFNGSNVYVFGASNDNESDKYRLCGRYDIHTNKWSMFASLKQAHCFGACVISNNTFYVCGGSNMKDGGISGGDVIEEFSFEDASWIVSRLRLPWKLNRHAMFDAGSLPHLKSK